MAQRPPRRRRRRGRRRRLLTRSAPLLLLAACAFAIGVAVATQPGRDERQLVRAYVTDWARGRVAAMYSLLDRRSRLATSEAAFARRLRADAQIATLRSLAVLRVGTPHSGSVRVWMAVDTRIWGVLREPLIVPFDGSGSQARVRLASELLFPGLRAGESLTRRTELATRATILAADGTPLAQGAGRTSPIPSVAGEIVGSLGPIPASQRAAYAALGYPPNAQVGQDGLELALQRRLVGRIGGVLLAGRRVLARVAPEQAPPVRTTIDPRVEEAAIAALGGRLAGIAAIDPRTGALEALSGIAYSAPQPPGSTMKIITATAALQAGLVKPTTVFPYATSATLDGYTMNNAGGEDCGGTLINAFAVSCNSVFAPLGARVGGSLLVGTAERYGFNHPTGIPGADESTIPPANRIGDALAVGSSAIGQGMVLATPLEMADVAATIAMGGRRPLPTLLAGQRPRFVRVTTPRVAHEIAQMMLAVVRYGTGTSAQIPGVQVAGKTGTAEVRNSTGPPNSAAANNPRNTDSWFVAYAPAGDPRVAVAAMFANAGYGATTAAPAVRSVIEAALGLGSAG